MLQVPNQGQEFTLHTAFLPAPCLDLLSHKNELSIGRQSIMASVLTSMLRTETVNVVAGPSFICGSVGTLSGK